MLKTVVIERWPVGGQASTSPKIENYLGFPQGISGAELAERAREQACRFGAEIHQMADTMTNPLTAATTLDWFQAMSGGAAEMLITDSPSSSPSRAWWHSFRRRWSEC